MEIKMFLEKAAQKNGGDKYAGKVGNEEMTIYFPQSISRKSGSAATQINITVEVK